MVGGNGGLDALAALVRLVADRVADPRRNRTRLCLLLGAGADIGSGGLTFTQLKRDAVEAFLKRPLFDVTQPEEIDLRFEEIFTALGPDERALLIEAIFRKQQDVSPSDAYKVLLLLAEAGGIDAVFTTNFDVMLEKAQALLGRDLIQVFAPGVARPYLLSPLRFDLPKKPYLKLHGDLSSRSVTLLTSAELTEASYDASMVELLSSILSTHDLVLAGYSGNDAALAEIIAKAVNSSSNRVYWCNPRPPSSSAPLRKLLGDRVREISISFDDLMAAVGRPVLEKPSLAWTQPAYIRCLFDWRVDYCNRAYITAYGQRSGRSLIDVFARRRGIEDSLAAFMRPNRPLAIITGPSGFGKSVVGIRLHKTSLQSSSHTRVLLIRARSLTDNGDLEQHLAEQLGGLGSPQSFSLFQLERWLKENGLRLLVYVDGINEFSPDLLRCVRLFRNILRLCYFLPEADSALRFVTTVRQETWNGMLPHLDLGQLRASVWSCGQSSTSVETIACSALTDEELGDAIARLADHGYGTIDTSKASASFLDQLRDPYLLSMVAEGAENGLTSVPNASIYHRAFEAKLRQRGSLIDTATMRDVLARMALKCLESPQERFRQVDIEPASMRGELIRQMKDLNVIVDAGDEFLRFDHDRTLEYFLSAALSGNLGPSLETLSELLTFLKHFKTNSKALAAARLVFHLDPSARFPLLTSALRQLDARDQRFSNLERELLFRFARDVLFEMAEQGDDRAAYYLADAIEAGLAGKIGEIHLRSVIQAAASLPIQRAVPLLTRAAAVEAPVAGTEAAIYATDKLTSLYLSSGCAPLDILAQAPYDRFFNDLTVKSWQRLGRLLWMAARLGPDNTHPDEYASFKSTAARAIAAMASQIEWNERTATEVGAFFLANCDRLMFNATPAGISRFFGNSRRKDFLVILDRLGDGACLTESDLKTIEPYSQSLSFDIEYHLGHLLIVLSSFNDLEATLTLVEKKYATFSDKTSPEQIDFFQACLVYLHVVHSRPYSEERFAEWEDKVLRSWPNVLLYRPGLDRGERRGFSDVFDRIFEDGFGVIYPYGILRPSLLRTQHRYDEYLRVVSDQRTPPLPLYSGYLDQFLEQGQLEEALQIIHALSAVIVAWPIAGLEALRGAIGHGDARIRRATVRVLAEAYNRHPDETNRFFRTSGVTLSDDDLIEIKIRQDARIGRRQISEEEWARIAHLLLVQPQSRSVLVASLRVLLQSSSFDNAVAAICQVLAASLSAAR